MRTEIVPQWDGTTWQPVSMVPLDLTYDHRVINGAEAAKLLCRFGQLLVYPKANIV